MTAAIDTSLKIAEFVQRFFANPNRIRLTDVDSGRWERVRPWVDDLRQQPPIPTVLPCWLGDRVVWYALAFSEAELALLREDLSAFVGPTHSTFRGYREPLDPQNPLEGAVLDLTAGWAFRFTGPLERDNAKPIWTALELMRTVSRRRPASASEAPRPTGRVLRDFYMALRAGNAASAEEQLRYLSDTGRLDPINLLFLRVQALAELGAWADLLGRPELPDLLEMRRPVAVSEALMRAVYETELKHFEIEASPDEAIEHFRSSVFARYDMLLGRRAGIRSPSAVKLLMLRAVVLDPQDSEARNALLATPDLTSSDRLYLRLLAERAKDSGTFRTNQATDAGEALSSGDFDRAFQLLAAQPSSIRRARGLLECAYELQTLEVERVALQAISSLDPAARAEALRGRLYDSTFARILGGRPQSDESLLTVDAVEQDSLVADAAAESASDEWIPANWIAWFERLTAEPHWEQAVGLARRGATEWSIDAIMERPGGPTELAECLGSAASSTSLQLALPHLITFFQRDSEWPRAELAPAYLWTLELLAHGSHGGENDHVVFNGLVEGVLSLGATPASYERLVEAGMMLSSGDLASYASVGAALDLLDSMVIYRCPDPELRVRFLTHVISLFSRFWTRLDDSQWDMLRTLCDELQQKEAFGAIAAVREVTPDGQAEHGEVLAGLHGRSVAIYTLTERAGKRMRDIIGKRVPGADVLLSHEKVGSESLRHLAKNADVFIVATASAKHAATGFIDMNRTSDRPTLRPAGKGTASMLRALYDFVRSEAPSKMHVR